jgi:hypothetical protein
MMIDGGKDTDERDSRPKIQRGKGDVEKHWRNTLGGDIEEREKGEKERRERT